MTPSDLMATTQAVSSRVIAVGPLQSAQDASQAAEVLRTLHAIRAEAEDARKAAKRPHLDAGRAVDAAYKPALKELDRVMALIKGRLSERALAADEARARALVEEPETANAILADLGDESHKGISERWSWEVEAVDLSQVPVEFLMLDEKKVKAAIKAADKEARRPRVPGVTFKRRVQIVARRERAQSRTPEL